MLQSGVGKTRKPICVVSLRTYIHAGDDEIKELKKKIPKLSQFKVCPWTQFACLACMFSRSRVNKPSLDTCAQVTPYWTRGDIGVEMLPSKHIPKKKPVRDFENPIQCFMATLLASKLRWLSPAFELCRLLPRGRV